MGDSNRVAHFVIKFHIWIPEFGNLIFSFYGIFLPF